MNTASFTPQPERPTNHWKNHLTTFRLVSGDLPCTVQLPVPKVSLRRLGGQKISHHAD